jgi:RNA polymerase sigma-70 factor (ECF subfamily)
MVLTKRHSYKVPKKGKAQKASKVLSYEAEITGLVEKAAGGDFEAFGELYNIYLDRIYRYVFYQVKDKMTAEDLLEEIFVKAWKAIGSYRGKGQAFSAWLYRIAHNYLVDYFRKSQKRRSLEIERVAIVASDEGEFEKRATRQELLEALSCLRDNQRQVIILKFIEGLDNREISQIMGKSQGAIRILQMRALAILQKILGSEE